MALWLTITECGCTEVMDDNIIAPTFVLIAEMEEENNPVIFLSEKEGQILIPE